MAATIMELLRYDSTGVLNDQTGLSAADLAALRPRLEAARQEVLDDAKLWRDAGPVPAVKQPLDAGFIELPDRLLAEYRTTGEESELGRIIAAAKQLAAMVDRVVVLGIGGSYMGARALMESCCHPYHNELSRTAREGFPRIYYEGNNVDNDGVQGLLDLVGRGAVATSDLERWGIVVISKSGGTLETAVALRQFLAALRQSCHRDAARVADLVIPVTGPSGRLFDLALAIGCRHVFSIPEGVGGRFSIFSAVGLLPAVLMGLDVIELLEGAAEMNRHFVSAPVESNVVLQYVGVSHLMEERRGATIRVMSAWSKSLEAAGLWYDQLLAESLGKNERQGAMPLTVVNTRDLHSRGQQHQEGRRDKLITNLIVDSPNRQSLAVGHSELDQDKLNELSQKTLPEIMTAAIQGTNLAYAGALRPTADLHLPQLNGAVMGQFFQMMMLATVAEGRLIGVNPYGQPGVEAYKKHMNDILRKK